MCNMVQNSRCAFLLVLWRLCASANGDPQIGCSALSNHTCETRHLRTALGSSVLLPCNHSTTGPKNAVFWMHSPNVIVVAVTSAGRVSFFDPRFGRINAFPNQGSRGNYSISIDNVNHTDLGCYRCLHRDKCVQVVVALKTESDIWLFPFSIYIISGVATFIVLCVGCFLCVNCFLRQNDETEDNHNITNNDGNDDLSHPAQEIGRESGDVQLQDARHPASPAYENAIVYENDNHVEDEPDYLNEIPGRCEMNREAASHSGQVMRVESQRTKQRFHMELFARLRQESIRKHHYVNQDELHKQRETASTKDTHKKKPEQYRHYPNPIYNRSTDSLDQM